jgi:hypothetical protein
MDYWEARGGTQLRPEINFREVMMRRHNNVRFGFRQGSVRFSARRNVQDLFEMAYR